MSSTIGERLGHLQGIAGITSREADRLAGKSAGQAAIIRARGGDVYAGTLLAYAELYGVTLDWLVAGKGPEPTADQVLAAVARARAKLEDPPQPPAKKKRSRSRTLQGRGAHLRRSASRGQDKKPSSSRSPRNPGLVKIRREPGAA